MVNPWKMDAVQRARLRAMVDTVMVSPLEGLECSVEFFADAADCAAGRIDDTESA